MEIQINEQDDQVVEGLASHSIKVAAGTRLKVQCILTAAHCEIQWMRINENITKVRTGPALQWSEIQEEDGGRYTCFTESRCSSNSITVEIEVISDGEYFYYE